MREPQEILQTYVCDVVKRSPYLTGKYTVAATAAHQLTLTYLRTIVASEPSYFNPMELPDEVLCAVALGRDKEAE